MKDLALQILRQHDEKSVSYWEEFRVATNDPAITVADALLRQQEKSINSQGRSVAPVAFEADCLQGDCGACAMQIDGKPRLACQTQIGKARGVVTLEPLPKHKVCRDLIVDRTQRDHAAQSLNLVPAIDLSSQESRRSTPCADELSACLHCGICLAACPNVQSRSEFRGPEVLVVAQIWSQQIEPTSWNRVASEAGISGCDNVQNCVQACPAGVPIADAIARLNRNVLKQAWVSFFE